MPIPAALLPPLIGAAGNVVGSVVSSVGSRMNYAKQKRDNIAFWNMQNAYNDPSQQMARLKNAGLNPNLVYGGGVSGATGQAGSISTPNLPPTQVPDFARIGTDTLNSIYTMEARQAQVDNLQAQKMNILADTYNKIVSGQTSVFDLDLKKELRSFTVEGIKAGVMQQKATLKYTLNKDQREAAMNAANLRESAARIIQMTAQTKHTRALENLVWKDVTLKRMDIDLRKNGINPSDPIYLRVLGRLMGKYIDLDSGNLTPLAQSLLGAGAEKIKKTRPSLTRPFWKW